MPEATALCMRAADSALRLKRRRTLRVNSISSLPGWGWWQGPDGCRHMGLRYRSTVLGGGMFTYFGG